MGPETSELEKAIVANFCCFLTKVEFICQMQMVDSVCCSTRMNILQTAVFLKPIILPKLLSRVNIMFNHRTCLHVFLGRKNVMVFTKFREDVSWDHILCLELTKDCSS